jgi:hypothetical protein
MINGRFSLPVGLKDIKETYEARNERWITAFRYGWKGVTIIDAIAG